MPVLDFHQKQVITDCAALYDFELYTHMYGSQCFGLVGDLPSLFQFFVNLTMTECDTGTDTDPFEEAAWVEEMARHARTDSMGTSTIVYFPGYEWGDE